MEQRIGNAEQHIRNLKRRLDKVTLIPSYRQGSPKTYQGSGARQTLPEAHQSLEKQKWSEARQESLGTRGTSLANMFDGAYVVLLKVHLRQHLGGQEWALMR
jgi:arginine/lysine/ornithine decarboxylase